MDDLEIINRAIDVKETIGSFKIFDSIDPVDHPAVYEFLKICHNYIKLSKNN